MSRTTDNRLRTICEVCRQWVRVKGQGREDVVRHHSRPGNGRFGGHGVYCPGSGAKILWSVPRSENTRGRRPECPGEDENGKVPNG